MGDARAWVTPGPGRGPEDTNRTTAPTVIRRFHYAIMPFTWVTLPEKRPMFFFLPLLLRHGYGKDDSGAKLDNLHSS